MKTILLSFIFVIVAVSCSTVDEDCLCTMEYRYTLVTVVDTLGTPVDSLTVTIKDNDGDELDVQQESSIFGAGKYTVLNDSFTHILCSCGTPQQIYF